MGDYALNLTAQGEDLPVAGKSVDALAQAHSAGIQEGNQGSIRLHSHRNDVFDFPGVHFAERPFCNGRILRKSKDQNAVHGPVTGHDCFRIGRSTEFRGALADECADSHEGAFVKSIASRSRAEFPEKCAGLRSISARSASI